MQQLQMFEEKDKEIVELTEKVFAPTAPLWEAAPSRLRAPVLGVRAKRWDTRHTCMLLRTGGCLGLKVVAPRLACRCDGRGRANFQRVSLLVDGTSFLGGATAPPSLCWHRSPF